MCCVHLQFLPSQHPADAPRVEYFSGEQCSEEQGGASCSDAVPNSSGTGLEQASAYVHSQPDILPDLSAAPNSLGLSSLEHNPCSIANVHVGVRGGTGPASEGADASMTEAHTPTLGFTSKHSKMSTLLTIAASTQSPRNHSPVPELCKQTASEAAHKEQDTSPCSVDGAAALAPPALLSEHGTALSLHASAGKAAVRSTQDAAQATQYAAAHDPANDQKAGEQHSSCMSEGMQSSRAESGCKGVSAGVAQDSVPVPAATVALTVTDAKRSQRVSGADASAEQAAISILGGAAVDAATAGSSTHTAPGTATDRNHTISFVPTEGGMSPDDDDDDDDLLFAVSLTNLSTSSTSAAGSLPQANTTSSTYTAAGIVNNVVSANMPQNSACPASNSDLGKQAQHQGYNAAAEAVMPQSRLQHASEEQMVKGLAAWGQHEHGLTLVQQREADRHIVQHVRHYISLLHTASTHADPARKHQQYDLLDLQL